MSERPLTRREMRELERLKERQQATGEPAAAETPEPAGSSETDSPPLAPHAEAAADAPVASVSSRPMTRRELRAMAARKEAEAAEERPGPVTRDIPRRPVQEPTTSSTIPAYGSVHVPVDEPTALDDTAGAPDQEPEPAEEPSADVSGTDAGDEADTETPERVSIYTSPSAESAGLAHEASAVTPAFDADEEDADEDHEDEPTGINWGMLVRFLVLIISFFIIGVLLWLYINSQFDTEPAAAGPIITHLT